MCCSELPSINAKMTISRFTIRSNNIPLCPCLIDVQVGVLIYDAFDVGAQSLLGSG